MRPNQIVRLPPLLQRGFLSSLEETAKPLSCYHKHPGRTFMYALLWTGRIMRRYDISLERHQPSRVPPPRMDSAVWRYIYCTQCRHLCRIGLAAIQKRPVLGSSSFSLRSFTMSDLIRSVNTKSIGPHWYVFPTLRFGCLASFLPARHIVGFSQRLPAGAPVMRPRPRSLKATRRGRGVRYDSHAALTERYPQTVHGRCYCPTNRDPLGQEGS